MEEGARKIKFKTPAELGVTEDEFCRLMRVAEGLQNGEYAHVSSSGNVAPTPGKKAFNMRHWRTDKDCGTVCCIGGWAGLLNYRVRESSSLERLCYPPSSVGNMWHDINERHAAKAIINWAMTGDPQWSNILAQKSESY